MWVRLFDYTTGEEKACNKVSDVAAIKDGASCMYRTVAWLGFLHVDDQHLSDSLSRLPAGASRPCSLRPIRSDRKSVV